MPIDNSRDYLAGLAAQGLTVTDHLVVGSNVQIDPGTYVPDYDNSIYDSVTFQGTAGRDTLLGGGGEALSFFIATRGDDADLSLHGGYLLT